MTTPDNLYRPWKAGKTAGEPSMTLQLFSLEVGRSAPPPQELSRKLV
jgi:hypothetical protein